MLFVFAGFFHLYRYGLSKSKDVPPPPPVTIDEKTKAIEETSKPELPDPSTESIGETKPKDVPVLPKIQADNEINTNTTPNLGTSDLNKP